MILFVGSYGAGMTVRLPRLPEAGETLGGCSMAIGHGGKSSNQAIAAARQGADVELITAVGDDSFGSAGQQLWDDEGIRHDAVKVAPTTTMSGIIMVEPNGQNRIAIAPGALDDLLPEDLDARRDSFAAADWVVVGLEIPAKTAERAIALAKECRANVILNPAPAVTVDLDRLQQVDVLVVNDVEHRFYARSGHRRPTQQTLIETLGEDGARLVTDAGDSTIPPLPQADVVDTTGAGDTFVGTLAAALDAGQELDAAARRAIVASSLSVTTQEVVPSIPDRDTVDAWLTTYLSRTERD